MDALLLPFLAVAAGVISFTSPCCLPLIPSYLSYVTALSTTELGTRQARAVTLRSSLLFVAGFTVVFTALGASFAFVGSALLANVPLIVRVAGVGIVLMGLGMLGVVRMPWLHREWRLGVSGRWRGPKGAFPLGMAFAFGWVPCVGPVLATILATAASTQTAPWGAALLALYSLGLGIPFVAMGVWFQGLRRSGTGCAATPGGSSRRPGCCWWEWECCSSPGRGAAFSSPCNGPSPAWAGRRFECVEREGIQTP